MVDFFPLDELRLEFYFVAEKLHTGLVMFYLGFRRDHLSFQRVDFLVQIGVGSIDNLEPILENKQIILVEWLPNESLSFDSSIFIANVTRRNNGKVRKTQRFCIRLRWEFGLFGEFPEVAFSLLLL